MKIFNINNSIIILMFLKRQELKITVIIFLVILGIFFILGLVITVLIIANQKSEPNKNILSNSTKLQLYLFMFEVIIV